MLSNSSHALRTLQPEFIEGSNVSLDTRVIHSSPRSLVGPLNFQLEAGKDSGSVTTVSREQQQDSPRRCFLPCQQLVMHSSPSPLKCVPSFPKRREVDQRAGLRKVCFRLGLCGLDLLDSKQLQLSLASSAGLCWGAFIWDTVIFHPVFWPTHYVQQLHEVDSEALHKKPAIKGNLAESLEVSWRNAGSLLVPLASRFQNAIIVQGTFSLERVRQHTRSCLPLERGVGALIHRTEPCSAEPGLWALQLMVLCLLQGRRGSEIHC